MSRLLAIATHPDSDDHLVRTVAEAGADAITVLVEPDRTDAPHAWAPTPAAERVRDRLARLIAGVEQRTGATVVGVVARPGTLSEDQFDDVVRAPALALAA